MNPLLISVVDVFMSFNVTLITSCPSTSGVFVIKFIVALRLIISRFCVYSTLLYRVVSLTIMVTV